MELHALLAGNGGLTNTGSKAGASQQEANVPKLAAKIKSGIYVPMKDMLVDNISLCSELEALPRQQIFSVSNKPRLQEVDSPLTWASCFLAYAAVWTSDLKTRNVLTYGHLVIYKAQRHSGLGWLEYDKIFRQHAALSSSTVRNELNPSFHESTVLSYRAGLGKVCSLCHELDHTAATCALLALHPHASSQSQAQPAHPTTGSPAPGPSWRPRQETIDRISVSWNKGRYTFPACIFRHICTVSREKGHRAKECHLDLVYKISQSASPKGTPGSSSTQGAE